MEHFCDFIATSIARYEIRDGEPTIKKTFCVFEGVGLGGREDNCPKTLFLLGNVIDILLSFPVDLTSLIRGSRRFWLSFAIDY